jgi:hypothetical protein
MHRGAFAQGEKRRHGGRLLLAIVAGVSGASIPALRPLLPFQSPAMAAGPLAQCSSVSFGCGFSSYRMRNLSPHHNGGSVKMRPIQTHSHGLIGFGLAGDLTGLVVLFTLSGLVWLRRNRTVRPPRVWALAIAVVWVSLQLLIYLKFAFGSSRHPDTTEIVQNPGISEISESGSNSAVIDRKAFSVSLPNRWKERTTDKLYNPDSFVFFIGPRSCFFKLEIGKNSPGISIDRLLEYEGKALQKDFTDATTSTIAKWVNFNGKGLEIEGTTREMTRGRVRLFAFKNADNVCLITEYGSLADLSEYAGDFEEIRQTFRLK